MKISIFGYPEHNKWFYTISVCLSVHLWPLLAYKLLNLLWPNTYLDQSCILGQQKWAQDIILKKCDKGGKNIIMMSDFFMLNLEDITLKCPFLLMGI